MKISVECNSNMLNDVLNDIIMKKALVCSYSYVNGRSVDAKAFFLLQMSNFAGSTHTGTLVCNPGIGGSVA